jgi:hypothetical protein
MVWLAVRVFGMSQGSPSISEESPIFSSAWPTRPWGFEAEHFDRAEGLLVELDGLGGVVDAEVGVMLCWPSGMGLTAMLRLSCHGWAMCALRRLT